MSGATADVAATAAATTDADGRFRLERLPAGTQVLVVRKLGMGEWIQTVVLSAHSAYTPTVAMRPKPPIIEQVNVVATPDQLAVNGYRRHIHR